MRYLLTILTALVLSCSMCANDNPVVHTEVLPNGMVITIHADLTMQVNTVDPVTMTLTPFAEMEVSKDGKKPVSVMRTSWVCSLGLTHTVETPVTSDDELTIAQAAMTHSHAITVQLAIFPVAPVTGFFLLRGLPLRLVA